MGKVSVLKGGDQFRDEQRNKYNVGRSCGFPKDGYWMCAEHDDYDSKDTAKMADHLSKGNHSVVWYCNHCFDFEAPPAKTGLSSLVARP